MECVSFNYFLDLTPLQEKLQRLKDTTTLVDFDGYFITKFRKSQTDSIPIVRKSDDYSQGHVTCYEITQVDHITDAPLPGMRPYALPQ